MGLKAGIEEKEQSCRVLVVNSVIPAQAGIQPLSVIPAQAGNQPLSVIPAQAGNQEKG